MKVFLYWTERINLETHEVSIVPALLHLPPVLSEGGLLTRLQPKLVPPKLVQEPSQGLRLTASQSCQSMSLETE